jgi:hypothetical protein
VMAVLVGDVFHIFRHDREPDSGRRGEPHCSSTTPRSRFLSENHLHLGC